MSQSAAPDRDFCCYGARVAASRLSRQDSKNQNPDDGVWQHLALISYHGLAA